MIKNVIIKINGTQEIDGSVENIELTTEGRFGINDGKYFLSYEEGMFNDDRHVKTQIFINSPDSFVVQRRGSVNSRMKMEKGKKNSCLYSMAEGSLLVGVYTEKVDMHISETGGILNAVYTIDSGMRILSRNTIKITIKEV
ncbi:MAG: DUF1934 domain-containing protein [Acutalibacteraceae bacterium]|jgi:uncharacterized beta-barrel protein YwiB (DUF1934 family)